MITFSDGLKQKWVPETVELEHFLQQQQARWGEPDFNRFELLSSSDPVTPFFDYDQEASQPVTEQVHQEHLQECLHQLRRIFADDPEFGVSRHIYWGSSHGFTNNKHKVSLRFWAWGYKMEMRHIPRLLDFFEIDLFDRSVYSAKQKLRIPGMALFDRYTTKSCSS